MKRTIVVLLLLYPFIVTADEPFVFVPQGYWRIRGFSGNQEVFPSSIVIHSPRWRPICEEKYGECPYLFCVRRDSLIGEIGFNFSSSHTYAYNPMYWGELRDYLFWKIETADSSGSFYSPCLAGDYEELINPYQFRKMMPIDPIPIPRDTTVYNLSLVMFDSKDTTGSILASSLPHPVLISPLIDELDSLLWFCSLSPDSHSVDLWDDILANFPDDRALRSLSLYYYRQAEEWERARDTVLLLLRMYENNVDFEVYDYALTFHSGNKRGLYEDYAASYESLRAALRNITWHLENDE